MKIVRQLANWLLENDRIDPEKYQKVLAAIQGGVGDGEGKMLHLADMRQRDRDTVEDSAEDWWCLRGAGGRAKASRRKGGRKAARDTKPIKVDELDPLLPDMLLPRGATPEAFPLAVLLVAVDKARGNRRTLDWAGFAASAAALVMRGDVIVNASGDRPDELRKALRDGYLRVVLMYQEPECRRERVEAMMKAAAVFDKLGQVARAEKLRSQAKGA